MEAESLNVEFVSDEGPSLQVSLVFSRILFYNEHSGQEPRARRP